MAAAAASAAAAAAAAAVAAPAAAAAAAAAAMVPADGAHPGFGASCSKNFGSQSSLFQVFSLLPAGIPPGVFQNLAETSPGSPNSSLLSCSLFTFCIPMNSTWYNISLASAIPFVFRPTRHD